MKALITGGTGFVGRALTVRLIADGHTVRVLTRNTPGLRVSLPSATAMKPAPAS